MAKQARLGEAMHEGQTCQEGRGRLDMRETLLMEAGRKSLHTAFRKYMHNPLDNEGLAQGIAEKENKGFILLFPGEFSWVTMSYNPKPNSMN